MKVWKDAEGKNITGKEFMQRWKAGIQKVTLKQQLEQSFIGYILIFIGILFGIFFTIKAKTYWLTTILVGSLIVYIMQVLGQIQKYIMIVNIQKEVKNG